MIRSLDPTSEPPDILNPHGGPPYRVMSRAVMMNSQTTFHFTPCSGVTRSTAFIWSCLNGLKLHIFDRLT